MVQGIAKVEKMDFLTQNSVELGVNRIIPIFSEYCVIHLQDEKL
ncbi:MAG: 16S rRNA (uracil(1498)-N(3))-methyltransferase [Candidatus Vesicomyosocius endoextente]|uniref:16S rRNA (Uracil(1498)-N(3))-methyltransferase n=1 Tax=Candidatus Vesicomyosocius endoextente TaxID=2738853 RepID=A0A853G2C9_9GAMM|nr:16S rRNA (uracil(1498)-N(3))-methyltransferase [Candidatus Vesicomyosocius endoextente]